MLATRVTLSARKERFVRPKLAPRLVSVGTATPNRRYTQTEVLDLFGEKNPKIRRLFKGGHIESRYLCLPEPVNGRLPEETNQQLLDKHLVNSLDVGSRAIADALSPVGLTPTDIDYFCCVSSTGFLCPSLTAHFVKKLGFRENVRRADILGMGCNAAMNGLQSVTAYSHSHPRRTALLLCVEICSAAYAHNDRVSTAVVNSLFGDGAAAVVVREVEDDGSDAGPMMIDFEPHIISDAINAMKYELDGTKLSFYLDRDIPYVIGAHVHKPVDRLLSRHGLKRRDIDQWLVHSGGKKVIDSIEYNLGLTDYDVRHTMSVLRDYGNLSSGSVMFSYQRLCREGLMRSGDLGVVIAMGPGTSIETGLLVW